MLLKSHKRNGKNLLTVAFIAQELLIKKTFCQSLSLLSLHYLSLSFSFPPYFVSMGVFVLVINQRWYFSFLFITDMIQFIISKLGCIFRISLYQLKGVKKLCLPLQKWLLLSQFLHYMYVTPIAGSEILSDFQIKSKKFVIQAIRLKMIRKRDGVGQCLSTIL